MNIASSTRATVNKIRLTSIVAKLSVVPQQPCKVIELTRLY